MRILWFCLLANSTAWHGHGVLSNEVGRGSLGAPDKTAILWKRVLSQLPEARRSAARVAVGSLVNALQGVNLVATGCGCDLVLV